MANIEVSQSDCEAGATNWPLLLDPEGYVTEGTYNFFMVQNGIPFTPDRNILRGISAKYIYELFGSEYVDITPYDIMNSDEAFVTATPFCMIPVTSLNGVKIGDGKPGELYNKLLTGWGNKVGIDIKAQIQKWDEDSKQVVGISPYSFVAKQETGEQK
jgi:branched-chain amino acid aminotransferase